MHQRRHPWCLRVAKNNQSRWRRMLQYVQALLIPNYVTPTRPPNQTNLISVCRGKSNRAVLKNKSFTPECFVSLQEGVCQHRSLENIFILCYFTPLLIVPIQHSVNLRLTWPRQEGRGEGGGVSGKVEIFRARLVCLRAILSASFLHRGSTWDWKGPTWDSQGQQTFSKRDNFRLLEPSWRISWESHGQT